MSRAVAAETNTAAVTKTAVYDDSMSSTELKKAAKEKGITGYSSMTKAQLLEVLNNGD